MVIEFFFFSIHKWEFEADRKEEWSNMSLTNDSFDNLSFLNSISKIKFIFFFNCILILLLQRFSLRTKIYSHETKNQISSHHRINDTPQYNY
jgi:hypothetical protein